MSGAVSRLSPDPIEHRAERLERVFARCFLVSHATRLVGGAREPLYQPGNEAAPCHIIYYRCDYFASALHEVAHWCIAGTRRRTQVDFGYWYAEDGRDDNQQRAFEAVEARPQALEWFFSHACAWPFRISVDNLGLDEGTLPDTTDFRAAVVAAARDWQREGLPSRAETFYRALAQEFGTDCASARLPFCVAGIA